MRIKGGSIFLAVIIAAAFAAPGALAQDDARVRLHHALKRLYFLNGDWRTCVSQPMPEGGWSAAAPQSLSFHLSMNDLYLETVAASGGYIYSIGFSYDQVQGRYRIASRDDQSGLLDIYEGAFDSDGALSVSNIPSGTHYVIGDVKHNNRMTFTPTQFGWTWLVEDSNDNGASWNPQLRVDARPDAHAGEASAAC